MENSSEGSVWRRWDLHVHTPGTKLSDSYGGFEENLDNQTIFDILVPVIKEAKLKRQIVMITHNPNIAVVCDAEQIIHANINKQDGNKVTYSPGAIEAPNINKHIVDVLEGTQPAFDNRRKKYLL